MIHHMLWKKTKAWHTSGTFVMVTSCVIRPWCFLSASVIQPTLKCVLNETGTKQKSSTTSQTWTQLFLSGTSIKSALASVTQQSMATPHSESRWDPAAALQTSSWQKPTSSAPCMNAFNHVRTRKQDLPSSPKVLVCEYNHIFRVHGHTVLHGEAAAKTFDEVGERSLERLLPASIEDSAEPASARASQAVVTQGPSLLPVQGTSEPWLQPSHGSST